MVASSEMHSFGRMIRIGAAAAMAIVLLLGCGSEKRLCDGNCPDVSGTFSLLSPQPLGSCGFASYLPPPTLTLTQSDGGRHVTTQLIDPTNQLLVSFEGNVFAPDGSSNRGSFEIQTQVLRKTSESDQRLVTLQLTLTGSVTRTADSATLSSILMQVQQQPTEGAGCAVTIPLSGRTNP